jgi:hypothetical protein
VFDTLCVLFLCCAWFCFVCVSERYLKVWLAAQQRTLGVYRLSVASTGTRRRLSCVCTVPYHRICGRVSADIISLFFSFVFLHANKPVVVVVVVVLEAV